MKRLIMLGGLVVLILLGGGIAYFLVPSGEESGEEAIEEAIEKEPEEPEEDQAEEGGHGASPPELQFVKMEILALPVVRRKALSHYLHVEASLQSPEKPATKQIPDALALVRDAIIREFYRTPLTAARGSNVDLAVLKARLQAAATQVLGEGVVEEVLLVNVIRGRR